MYYWTDGSVFLDSLYGFTTLHSPLIANHIKHNGLKMLNSSNEGLKYGSIYFAFWLQNNET